MPALHAADLRSMRRICRTIAASAAHWNARKYERLVRRRGTHARQRQTCFEHESLPVRKTGAHLRKPAGQAGKNGNPREIICVPFW